jgi:hypothetical protein
LKFCDHGFRRTYEKPAKSQGVPSKCASDAVFSMMEQRRTSAAFASTNPDLEWPLTGNIFESLGITPPTARSVGPSPTLLELDHTSFAYTR